MFAVTAEHHSLLQEIEAMTTSALAGGAAWRYGAIFAKDLPKPLPGERIYAYVYNVLQDLANNPEGKAHFVGSVTVIGPGGNSGGGDPK